MTRLEQIERSIQKTYRAKIWTRFIHAIKTYKLISRGDRIAVCISGGKDSMLLAKLVQALQKYSEFEFEAEYIVMNPGYNAANLERILQNAKLLNIPINVFNTDIFGAVEFVEKSPCYLCARMRRGHLYAKAAELGCNKIALGHHFDDVIETTLMGMLYGAQMQGMMPKVKSANFSGMELIRPLYCVHEESIIAWQKHNELEFIQCACRFTEKSNDDHSMSKRLEMKNLIRELKKTNPQVDHHIFMSIHNVNIDTLIAYKKDGVMHNFLDEYDFKHKDE